MTTKDVEKKKKTMKRLLGLGKWGEFLELREREKTKGLGEAEAWDAAAKELLGPAPVASAPAAAMGGADGESGPGESVSADVWAKKPVINSRQVVEWVAGNLDASCRPEDSPSSDAWALLCWVRESDRNRHDFWSKIYMKLLPSRAQMGRENAAASKRTNGTLQDAIDRVEAALRDGLGDGTGGA